MLVDRTQIRIARIEAVAAADKSTYSVIPTKVGIHVDFFTAFLKWIPAFAGMTIGDNEPLVLPKTRKNRLNLYLQLI